MTKHRNVARCHIDLPSSRIQQHNKQIGRPRNKTEGGTRISPATILLLVWMKARDLVRILDLILSGGEDDWTQQSSQQDMHCSAEECWTTSMCINPVSFPHPGISVALLSLKMPEPALNERDFNRLWDWALWWTWRYLNSRVHLIMSTSSHNC